MLGGGRVFEHERAVGQKACLLAAGSRAQLAFRSRAIQRYLVEASGGVPVAACVEQARLAQCAARAAEARAAGALPTPGQAAALAQPARADGGSLRAVALLEAFLPAFVQLLVGLAGDAANRAVDAPGQHLRAVVVGHRRERVGPVGLQDELYEARAVQVPDVGARPAPRQARHLVEPREVV